LVLAIIGIISAIAIPALLSQRARARDKATIENLTGAIGDLVGQYDKLKEEGLGSGTIKTSMVNYLNKNHSKDKNPWIGSLPAFPSSISAATGNTTQSTFIGAINAPTVNGGMALAIQFPSGSIPGFFGGKVKIGNKVNGSTVFSKATAIE